MAQYSPEIEEDDEIEESDLDLNPLEAPEEMDETEVSAFVGQLIDDAIDFTDNELAQDRIKSTDYLKGKLPKQDDQGRSAVVSYDVADTVAQIMPSLMRIFYGSKNIMQFIPKSAEDVKMAEQCTEYISHIITEEQGDFMTTLMSCFKDALVRRTGILKYWYEEKTEVETTKYTGLDENQVELLAGGEDVEDLEAESISEEGEIPLFDVSVKRRKENGRIRIEALPPEEFLLDRRAKDLDSSRIVAHRCWKTKSDLIALGYDEELLDEVGTGKDGTFGTNQEFIQRHSQSADRGSNNVEPGSQTIQYIEAYVFLDVDQDGISERRRIATLGNSHKIVLNEPCDYQPFVMFTPDPEPHSAIGNSITDKIADIQRIKSGLLRNCMDSLVMSVSPRLLVKENACNLSDVLNTEVGSIIRTRENGAVVPLESPFVGNQVIPILQMLDDIKATRTGITKVSQGLDTESLTSTARVGIDASVKASMAHTELLARIFAETGLKQLYKGVLKLVVRYQDRERIIRLRNEWVPIDPREFDVNMDLMVDLPLGAGTDMEKMQFLNTIIQKQETLLNQLGPENPLVNYQQYFKTLSKMAELAGYKDPNQFFTDPSQYQAPPPPDPETQKSAEEKFIELQGQKIMMDAQIDAQKLELEKEKMIRLDDREKDRIESQTELSIMEMQEKYDTTVDSAKIRGLMERDREKIKQEAMIAKTKMAQRNLPNA